MYVLLKWRLLLRPPGLQIIHYQFAALDRVQKSGPRLGRVHGVNDVGTWISESNQQKDDCLLPVS